ncbi:MAG: HAMP domain-containing protein [Nitrospirae bacterium]|nr:MAG: HAMP domain-containing protein [Nitrospirota bacterium]
MDQPRTGGLQKKFFVALLIVGILPGVGALIATYLYSTDSLKHSIGNGFQEIARSTAIRIAAAVDTEIDRAARLALVPIHIRHSLEVANKRYAGKSENQIRRLLETEQAAWSKARTEGAPLPLPGTTAYLREWAQEAGYYVGVVIADSRGALVATSTAQTSYLNEDQDWWREAFEERTAYVSSIRHDPALNDYLFDVSVPILDDGHTKPIGVVGLVIRRDVLMNTILPIRIGETGHGMLLDTEGTPLICPVLPPTAHLIHETLLNQLARDRPIWLVAEDDAHGGHNSIVGAAPVRFAHQLSASSLGGEQWFTFVRQQPKETYAPIYSLLVTVGLIGFGLVIGLASLGFLVGRRIVRPILALRREADALRRNVASLPDAIPARDGTARPASIDIRTGDELEDLARTFEAMRNALEESLRTVKTQQEELIRREKLASVGQLLAALAHDLRNPLGVIRSSAQLILEEQQTESVKQEVARYIIEEVDRLTHRINDFLRYARQKPPEPKTVLLRDLAEAALRQWSAQGSHELIALDTNFAAPPGPVQVDPDQVKEALANLLANAREAMPQGGRLTVATRAAEHDQMEIEIADTGCGIAPAHLEHIFEPFFTTKEYGTGLGLTNVKRLIQDNGGALEVRSHEGAGSRFIIRFPMARETATAGDAAARGMTGTTTGPH